MTFIGPIKILICCIGAGLFLSGCSGPTILSKAGKFYDNDGPPDSHHALDSQETIELKVEKPSKAASRPYTVMGKRYYPMTGDKEFTQVGIASWYGKQFHGRKTAIGERYDMFAMTAAHPTMELPSYARVTNLKNGKSVIVRVNDRGPFLGGRAIDMSYAAAVKLGYHKAGTTRVKIERITRRDIASGKAYRVDTAPLEKASEPIVVAQERKEVPSVTQESLPAIASAAPQTEEAVTNLSQSTPAPESTSGSRHEEEASLPEIDSGTVTTEEAPAEMADATPESVLAEPKDAIGELLNQEEAAVSAAASSPTWRVQIGAFSNETNAREVAAHAEMMLSEQEVSQRVDVLLDGKLYRVLIGSEETREAAQLLSKKISNLLGTSSFVIQR